ncbi:MAG: methylenetetrahydrofolate reductase [Candidatus Altiarchaeota archaeon]
MNFSDKLMRGEFAVTGEITPHKGVNPGRIREVAKHLIGVVDAINVTDNQRSSVKASSLAVSRLLIEWGGEPIYQLTCRDRNRIALQSDLLGAHMLGLRNVLIISGDHPAIGDHPDAKPVYDLDSVRLIETIGGLNQGRDMSGGRLDENCDFFAGAAVNPCAHDQEVELIKARRKIAAGAMFFQTQVVYDVDMFKAFMSQLPKEAKVLAGIIPLKSEKMADFMSTKMPGVSIPADVIAEIAKAKDPCKAGLDQAVRIIREIRPHASGVHIMALGLEEHVKTIISEAGLHGL